MYFPIERVLVKSNDERGRCGWCSGVAEELSERQVKSMKCVMVVSGCLLVIFCEVKELCWFLQIINLLGLKKFAVLDKQDREQMC
jgi:hypothetical protein